MVQEGASKAIQTAEDSVQAKEEEESQVNPLCSLVSSILIVAMSTSQVMAKLQELRVEVLGDDALLAGNPLSSQFQLNCLIAPDAKIKEGRMAAAAERERVVAEEKEEVKLLG